MKAEGSNANREALTESGIAAGWRAAGGERDGDCGRYGSSPGRDGSGCHSSLGIEEAFLVGTKAQLDEGARIRDYYALPAIVGLEAFHRFLAGGVPLAGGLAVEVILADQRFLDLARAVGVNLLLAAFLLLGSFAG